MAVLARQCLCLAAVQQEAAALLPLAAAASAAVKQEAAGLLPLAAASAAAAPSGFAQLLDAAWVGKEVAAARRSAGCWACAPQLRRRQEL